MQDDQNEQFIQFVIKFFRYPYRVYRAILLTICRPLIKKQEELMGEVMTAQIEQAKKIKTERECLQAFWKQSFAEMKKIFDEAHVQLEESLCTLRTSLSVIQRREREQCVQLEEKLHALYASVSVMQNEEREGRVQLEESLRTLYTSVLVVHSQDREGLEQLEKSLNVLQTSFSDMQNTTLQAVDWNREAVYEVRNENRIHATLLQKLQEHDIELNETYRNEIHRHIDFTYRDLMTLLRGKDGVWSKEVTLETDFPIAYESNDTLRPHGTIRDNTRCPRFIFRCEQLFPQTEHLNFLDLGCSGGGMVLEALLRGHYALGLEGCDESMRQQRAEWRLIPEHLKTCDISKPFSIKEKSSDEKVLFDVVTAWEVLEHISESELPQLVQNIYNTMAMGSIFVATVAAKTDTDPVTGRDWHQTIRPFIWWKSLFEAHGFVLENDKFTVYDLARGVYNPPHCYEQPYDVSKANFDEDFYLVARKTVKILEKGMQNKECYKN